MSTRCFSGSHLDALLGAQHELRGEIAQAHDHIGPDAADLLAQIRRAGLDLLGLGIAVAGWAALDHVGDVDILAAQARLGEQPVELLPGGAYEGLFLQVLVAAGALAHEHDARMRIADAEDQVGARLAERAPMAVAHAGAHLLEGDLAGARLGMTGNLQLTHTTDFFLVSLLGSVPFPGITRRPSRGAVRNRRRPRS